MNKYKYNGEVEIYINGVGVVQPAQEIETELFINNPLFQNVKNIEKVVKKENK